MTLPARLVSIPIHVYRLIGSPFFGMHCRFDPTCSAYALQALEKHGAVKGLGLTVRRLARCHPWGGSGVDRVPD
ncbi:MAG: membrane protein insertion efficiency factor YidD [Rhodobacteraceae bacterium]|nr:membrane protein insertion efficiency factor YidD [Paracoccaceae bacterium]